MNVMVPLVVALSGLPALAIAASIGRTRTTARVAWACAGR